MNEGRKEGMNEMNETHILSLSDPHPDNYTDIVYHIPSVTTFKYLEGGPDRKAPEVV